MRLRSLSSTLALTLALIVGAALAPAPASAQQPPAQPSVPPPSASHVAAARELVILIGATGTIDRLLPEIEREIRQQAVTRPDLAKDLDQVIKALQPEFAKARDQAIGLIAVAYTRVLSEADIREAIAFFKTPAGAKYAQAQPDLTEDVVDSLSAWSQLAERDLMQRVRTEMQKRGQTMQ